ncbi:MAG: 50S ribosomal protein L18 [Oscillospiraceae bacterium]|nr:50S ribosomal protein L18 [Oscillospiraceae bacterium]
MVKKESKNENRERRHNRIRKNISGTNERPRLSVFRSNKNIYAQIIDDTKGITIVAASTKTKGFDGPHGNKEAAKKIGEEIARKALDKGISKVVFDRGGYIYHGRVKELAEGAREVGLQF